MRLALIGLGWAVRELWAPRIDAHPAYSVVAAHDPDPAARTWAAGRFPSVRVLTDPDELDATEVDLAIVATPNHLHASTAISLLERGIPVFVEKPVCVSTAEAVALAEAERAGGAHVLAGTAAWYRADVMALRELLPDLGPLRAVDASWVRASGIPAPGGWFTERRRAGGGAMVDLGWHVLTVGMRLASWPRVTDVTGAVSADFLARAGAQARWRGGSGEEQELAPKDVEDTARGVLTLDGGPLFSVHAAWASHASRDVTRLILEGADARAELTCTFGMSPNRVASKLVVHREGEVSEVALSQEEPGAEYRRQLDLLPALLADPGQRGVATAEVSRTIDVIERLYRRAGAPVLPSTVNSWPDHSSRDRSSGYGSTAGSTS